MPRPLQRLGALGLAIALLAGGLSALAAPPAPADPRALYIVRLAAPPPQALAADSSAATAAAGVPAAGRAAALRSIAALGAPAEPVFTYAHALSGFALPLSPAEAAAVAALPGVAAVTPDYTQELHSDTGPAHIGAAQADLRPAIFFARLSAPQRADAGDGVFVYDAATRELEVQLFYAGLAAAPSGAALRAGPGGPVVAQLGPLAVAGAGAAGGYVGAVTLPDAAAAEALLAGGLYAELAAAGGVARGQLRPADGAGVLVGVLDSGINYDSPSFASPAPDGYRFTNPLGQGVYRGVCDEGRPDYDPSFACNDKLIGAYTFASTDESPDPQGRPSPRDNHGHGSHTASTVAGNRVPAAPVGGATVGPIAGVAPRASLIVYDVCGLEPASDPQNALRCSTAAILAAIDQAVADGVEVINYSIGGGSRDPWASPDSAGFLVATAGGAFVAASAGNTGPDASTIGAPANAPWLMAVGAATHGRRFANSLAGFAGGSAGARPAAPIAGRGFSAAFGPAPILDAAAFPAAVGGAPNPGCEPFAPDPALAGAILICRRGALSRLEMAANAQAAGAGGAVIVNDVFSGGALNDDRFPLPAVQIGFNEGQALLAWAAGCAGCSARIGGTTRALDPSAADLLASFSARGPDRSNPDVLKPDLVAPGVDILAAAHDLDPLGPDYQLLSGTSMAAPHVAGAAALLRQIHPDWTPAEIKSALMLTADGGLRREGGAALTPYDRGAGRLSVARAARAGLVLDERYARFLAADPALRGDPGALNLPSLAERACAATCVFTRTVRSTLGVTSTWTARSSAAAPLALSVAPASFTLAPGASRTVVVTARIGEQPVGSAHFGTVTLGEAAGLAPDASMPVAVQSAISTLPTTLSLTTERRVGGLNLPVSAWAIGDTELSVYGLARLVPTYAGLAQDPTPGDLGDVESGGLYTKALTLPAGTTRFRAELGASAAADLDLFVFVNSDGDGRLENGELLCSSLGAAAEELCEIPAVDLIAGRESALPVAVLVQSLAGSRPADPDYVDAFTLRTAVVGRTAAGNLSVSAPPAVPSGQAFTLGLGWRLDDARPGDVYIGVVGVGSGPGAPGDRGAFSLTLTYSPYRVNLPLVRRP